MLLKILYTILVLIICILIYIRIRNNEHSLGFVIVTGIIAAIIGSLLIPSNISLFDIINYVKLKLNKTEKNFSDITLNLISLELISTDEYDLYITTLPNNYEIEWISDNEDIVTIDSKGHLKAINEGNATITASIIYKNIEYIDTCNISVKNPIINLDAFRLLYIGENKNLSVTTIPQNTNIFWSSSDTDIVTVSDNGKIKGISEGTAVIKATMVYNNINYLADCAITVKERPNRGDNDKNNIKSDNHKISDSSSTLEDGKTPLSSVIFVRMNQGHGYMVNNDYMNLQGDGYSDNYKAMSMGIEYDEVISACSYTPFELIYNLEGKYSVLSGEVTFDDICLSEGAFGTQLSDEADIIFYIDDKEKETISIKLTSSPQPFNVDVTNGDILRVVITFPYYNAVFDNFNKYFNIINAYLE